MKNSEAFEIIKELVEKFIDVDQSHLTSYDKATILGLLDDFKEVVERYSKQEEN